MIYNGDIVLRMCDEHPHNDTDPLGGGLETVKPGIVEFTNVSSSGNLEIVSDNAGDSGNVTVKGKSGSAGDMDAYIEEVKALNGTTPVPMTTNTVWKLLMGAEKAASASGNVAIMAVDNEHSGTAQAGGDERTLIADSGAISTDNDYLGCVIRITGGTGAPAVRRIVGSFATGDKIKLNQPVTGGFDASTTFEIARGIVLDKSPTEIMQAETPYWEAASEAEGGSNRDIYAAFCAINESSQTLTQATITEVLDSLGIHDFALEDAIDDTEQVANRLAAPSGITGDGFSSTEKAVPNSGNLLPGSYIKVWIKKTVAPGTAHLSVVRMGFNGNSMS